MFRNNIMFLELYLSTIAIVYTYVYHSIAIVYTYVYHSIAIVYTYVYHSPQNLEYNS